MATIQIRNVPEEVHRALTRQAEEAGLSLNRFMVRELERTARQGRNAEILRRADERGGDRIPTSSLVETIRKDRERPE